MSCLAYGHSSNKTLNVEKGNLTIKKIVILYILFTYNPIIVQNLTNRPYMHQGFNQLLPKCYIGDCYIKITMYCRWVITMVHSSILINPHPFEQNFVQF